MDPSREEQKHQEMGCETLESMLVCTNGQQEKKPRPLEQALKCPRCDSTNTKFCYYNNYSLTQPRYFCKSCRRYWTKGGTLRNVPVGGGCRKNKRLPSSSKRGSQDPAISSPNPNPFSSSLTGLSYDSDISLAIARLQKQNVGQLGFDNILGNPNYLQSSVLGNLSLNSSAITPAGMFLENPNGNYQNLYYGNMGHLENGGLSVGINGVEEMPYDQEMGGVISTTTTVTPVKQEMCNPREGESRVLMGFPWQIGGEGNAVDFEPAKQNWNGFGSSSWHGLLNSPLM